MAAFISDCNADARVLAEIMSKARAKHKHIVSKHKKLKKKSTRSKHIKPKIIAKDKTKVITVAKPQKIITKEELDIRNDVAYLPNEDKPFIGKHEKYHSNGKKYVETNYKNGKKDGSLILFDEDERKIGEIIYKDGKRMDF